MANSAPTLAPSGPTGGSVMSTSQPSATPPLTNPIPQNTPKGVDTSTIKPEASVARLLKLKVDGQEFELPESEVITLAQQGKSAGKRFQEAAAAKKEAEQIVNFLKANPKEAMRKLGIDPRKFSEDTLMEIITQEQMSPEQRKAIENENRLKEYEAREKQAQEQSRQAQLAELERSHMESYDKMFVQALTESGLPKTPYTVKRMAELTLVNVKRGLNLEPSQLAKIVREDYQNEMKALYGQADGDALLELLGKEGVKKLSKAQLTQYKSKHVNNAVKRDEPKDGKPQNSIEAWKAMKKKTRSLL